MAVATEWLHLPQGAWRCMATCLLFFGWPVFLNPNDLTSRTISSHKPYLCRHAPRCRLCLAVGSGYGCILYHFCLLSEGCSAGASVIPPPFLPLGSLAVVECWRSHVCHALSRVCQCSSLLPRCSSVFSHSDLSPYIGQVYAISS